MRNDAKRAATLGQRQLWPIFVLTRGRPQRAHLNWAADHVLGAQTDSPIVAVVDPSERAEYRRCWPAALLLVLPASGRPVGYARHVLKRACEWRAPFFWMVDDNIAGFVKVEADAEGTVRRD